MTSHNDIIVVDASALVALLTSDGAAAEWVVRAVAGAALAAPSVAPYEVASALRRLVASGKLDATAAGLAHADILSMPLDLWPYAVLGERVWKLRNAITAYDAAYVALAELLDAPLVTLDNKLARAPGTTCEIRAAASLHW